MMNSNLYFIVYDYNTFDKIIFNTLSDEYYKNYKNDSIFRSINIALFDHISKNVDYKYKFNKSF